MDFEDMQYAAFGASSVTSFGQPRDSSSSLLPHQGSLCRVDGKDGILYILEILVHGDSTHELHFQRKDFEFSMRLFAIIDTDSRGHVSKASVKEFVTMRCPVFWKRDDNLRLIPGTLPTFEEVWSSVVTCSVNPGFEENSQDLDEIELGVEGWMVFCRFIALAQYMEAKRRFSGRHLQQTMRHRNAPRGSELVVVDVPPPVPPIPLSANQLAQYERESHRCLPLPELDLDHSLLAAHDVLRRRKDVNNSLGRVKLELFGSPSLLLTSQSSQGGGIEFCLTFVRHSDGDGMSDSVSVRRSMKDMKWLNETLVSHRVLGGTLCGRILPPFPNGNRLSSQLNNEDSSMGSTGDAIAAAATAGVQMIKGGIKSFWGSYATTTTGTRPQRSVIKSSSIPESYYNPNSPDGIARQLERYLNYLLDHPALSTSFPLNTILKSSQSGLEAAKQSLEEHSRASTEIKEQTPNFDDGKLSTFFTVQGSQQPNLSWVRTAAQAAVAIQLHGVLETSGLPVASARLQHASLPNFGHSRKSAWADDDGELHNSPSNSTNSAGNEEEESFEEGVLHVNDELESDEIGDDVGYDLLPLPVPIPERTVLAAGDTKKTDGQPKEARFRYGSPDAQAIFPTEDATDGKPVYIGEMVVDENIDKLREVIGSVDNTLTRCLASSGGIGRARRQKLGMQLDIVRGLDSWEGLRGKFVSQRALIKGVSGIEQSREVFEESDLMLIDDVSWQASLANSAVSAAEDVRATVRAARTATSAKTTANTAAITAQKAVEEGKFSVIDEARAAQTRASIAQSHAIHATVVEHEAKTAKRRATLALAHDVKCWNKHRKREILETCLSYAKSQHEATRRAVDAWSCLADGYVGSAAFPTTQSRRVAPAPRPEILNDEPQATIYGDSDDLGAGQVIVAVEHELLRLSVSPEDSSSSGEVVASAEPETILPLVVASPIPEEGEEEDVVRGRDDFASSLYSQSTVNGSNSHSTITGIASQKSMSSTSANLSPSATFQSQSSGASSSLHSKSKDEEILTASMQSLVDGLMNWGGQIEEEDFALPTGMAASIALEESVLGSR